jgi:hypothetical protein
MRVCDVHTLRNEIERAIGHVENVRANQIQASAHIGLKFDGQRLAAQADDQAGAAPRRSDRGPR